MSGDMHILSSNGNEDILLKNFLCKYILVNIAAVSLAYEIVFQWSFSMIDTYVPKAISSECCWIHTSLMARIWLELIS